MVVIEVEQLAVLVQVSGLCWSSGPGRGLVQEEVQGSKPGEGGYQNVGGGLGPDAFFVAQFHDNVESCI